MNKILAAAFVSVVMLFSTSCGTSSTLVTLLNAVADSASVATIVTQSLVATGKVSQADATKVTTYAIAVSTAVNQSITELSSPDSNSVKITDISRYFATVLAPTFPNDSSLVSVVQSVVVAITQFISQLNSPSVTSAATRYPTTVSLNMTLTHADRSLLGKTKKTTASTIALATKIKSK